MMKAKFLLCDIYVDEDADPYEWAEETDDDRLDGFYDDEWAVVTVTVQANVEGGESMRSSGRRACTDQPAEMRKAFDSAIEELEERGVQLQHLAPRWPDPSLEAPEWDFYGAACPPLGAQRPATTHEQTVVVFNGEEIEVDSRLAGLLYSCWTQGMKTVMSCEDNDGGRVWIQFSDARDAQDFLTRSGLDGAVAQGPGEWNDDGRFNGKVSLRSEPNFLDSVSVRFPRERLEEVEEMFGVSARMADAPAGTFQAH